MQIVEPAPAVVEAFWAAYVDATGERGALADTYAFGDSAEMAEQLAALVLAGRKRATAGALVELERLGVEVRVGDLSVLHDGRGTPVAVLRTTDVRVGPLASVDDRFAWDEGEGDRTRDGWLAGHRAYFARTLAPEDYDPDELVTLFERFEVAWLPPGPMRPDRLQRA